MRFEAAKLKDARPRTATIVQRCALVSAVVVVVACCRRAFDDASHPVKVGANGFVWNAVASTLAPWTERRSEREIDSVCPAPETLEGQVSTYASQRVEFLRHRNASESGVREADCAKELFVRDAALETRAVHVVRAHMRGVVLDKFKVLYAIVEAVVVLVMDHLAALQFSTEVLLHHYAMFSRLTPSIRVSGVAVFVGQTVNFTPNGRSFRC